MRGRWCEGKMRRQWERERERDEGCKTERLFEMVEEQGMMKMMGGQDEVSGRER